MEILDFLGIIPIIIYLGILIFAIYVTSTFIKLMKQKNDYLKDIRDEIRKNNSVN